MAVIKKSFSLSEKAWSRLNKIMIAMHTDIRSRAVEESILKVDMALIKDKKSLRGQK